MGRVVVASFPTEKARLDTGGGWFKGGLGEPSFRTVVDFSYLVDRMHDNAVADSGRAPSDTILARYRAESRRILAR